MPLGYLLSTFNSKYTAWNARAIHQKTHNSHAIYHFSTLQYNENQ